MPFSLIFSWFVHRVGLSSVLILFRFRLLLILFSFGFFLIFFGLRISLVLSFIFLPLSILDFIFFELMILDWNLLNFLRHFLIANVLGVKANQTEFNVNGSSYSFFFSFFAVDHHIHSRGNVDLFELRELPSH